MIENNFPELLVKNQVSRNEYNDNSPRFPTNLSAVSTLS